MSAIVIGDLATARVGFWVDLARLGALQH